MNKGGSPRKYIQADLRHRLGKPRGAVKLGGDAMPTIACDEAGWVKIDDILGMDGAGVGIELGGIELEIGRVIKGL